MIRVTGVIQDTDTFFIEAADLPQHLPVRRAEQIPALREQVIEAGAAVFQFRG